MTELEVDHLCRTAWATWNPYVDWDGTTRDHKRRWQAMIRAVIAQVRLHDTSPESGRPITALPEEPTFLTLQRETNRLLGQLVELAPPTVWRQVPSCAACGVPTDEPFEALGKLFCRTCAPDGMWRRCPTRSADAGTETVPRTSAHSKVMGK